MPLFLFVFFFSLKIKKIARICTTAPTTLDVSAPHPVPLSVSRSPENANHFVFFVYHVFSAVIRAIARESSKNTCIRFCLIWRPMCRTAEFSTGLIAICMSNERQALGKRFVLRPDALRTDLGAVSAPERGASGANHAASAPSFERGAHFPAARPGRRTGRKSKRRASSCHNRRRGERQLAPVPVACRMRPQAGPTSVRVSLVSSWPSEF